MAKLLGVSPTSIAKNLSKLEKEEYIKTNHLGTMNLNMVELNRENPDVIAFKRAENQKMLYETGFTKFIEEKFPGTTVILFGSYSYGEDIVTSDIDIAIIGIKQQEIKLETFEKKLERKINLQFYDNLKEINKNLKNNILNGIILNGQIEL